MMRSFQLQALVICWVMMSVGRLHADDNSQDPLLAGVSTIDITPPIPYRMSGYFSERTSTGIKDPLHAKAIVWKQGDVQCVWICCDLIGMAPAVSKPARQQIAARLGIPVDNISISATHSHTGPLYAGALRELFHRRSIERHGKDELESTDYPALLIERMVDVARQAQEQMQPVDLQAGYASEDRLVFNRRFHMRDGSVRFNPGQKNTDIVRVAGPIDPQVAIVTLTGAQSKHPDAALVSYALHLDTVGGTEYSADYPFYLERVLQSTYGDDFMLMYGTGTCGDINHIDVSTEGRRSAEEIGTILGKTVATAIPDLKNVSSPRLAVVARTVNLPLQKYTPEQTAAAWEKLEGLGTNRMSFLETVEAYKIASLSLRGGDTLPVEVHAFCLSNDVAIVMLPGEVFVELGMAIKLASPFETTLVVELTNDAPGYIPTRKAFAEGSYETVNSRLASGGGEEIVKIANELLKELKR